MADRVRVGRQHFDLLTRSQLIDHVACAIGQGEGGTIVTANVDICRQARRDPVSGELVAAASLVVPDGMPLLWAARLAGRPLAGRVAGADLIFALSESAAANGWHVYLLGGLPGGNGQPGMAERAADRLRDRYPGLMIAGISPPARFDAVTGDIDALRASLTMTRPRIVFVGLGFPKQEQLIARLVPHLAGAWFVGCGAAIPYAAGDLRRAPGWMQRGGLEWLFRLVSEPRRLACRYLIQDVPFATWLLASSMWQRCRLSRRALGGKDGLEAPVAPRGFVT